MVDINTSASALQAQLQASKPTNRLAVRPSFADNNAPTPQDVVGKRIDERRDVPTPDRRAPAKQAQSSNNLSSSSDIEDASRRAQQFSLTREAPTGRFSNAPDNQRAQPLGQIVNILV